MAEIALLIVVLALAGVVGVQSYFLYRASQTVAILKAAPDAESARMLLKAAMPKKKEEPKVKKRNEVEVSPAELDAAGIANLRRMQDAV